MSDSEAVKRGRGRPRKPRDDDDKRRSSHTVWLAEHDRDRVLESARLDGNSISEEIAQRVRASFDSENLSSAIIGGGLLPSMFRAMHQTIRKVQRIASSVPEAERSAQFELNTRRELRAAVDVVTSVYMATEAGLPPDPQKTGEPRGAWGSGYFGRNAAYGWLEWEGDNYLDQAQGTAIYDDWTGDGRSPVADLMDLGLLTPEQANRRRFPHGEPPPLAEALPRRGRNTSADTPSELLAGEPPAKSTRARRKPA